MQFIFGSVNVLCRINVASSALIVFLSCLSVYGENAAEKAGPRAIDFEEYRNEDGVIDYVNALNTYSSRGVAPENNAAVGVFAQINPLDYDAHYIQTAWERLGVDPPEQPGTWISWRDELKRLGVEDEAEQEELTPDYHTPWSNNDYPKLAEWLDRMAPALGEITTALKAKHGWMPLVGKPGMTINAHKLPHLSISRDLAKCLCFRIGLAIQEQRYADAIRDVGTMRRLGRFLRQGAIVLEQLVGISIHRMSHGCITELCLPGRLTAEQLAELFTVVAETRSPGLQMHMAFDTGDRAVALEAFEHLLRSDEWRPLYFHDWMTEERAKTLLPRLHKAFNHPGFDRAVALETIQKNYDDHWKIAGTASNQEFKLMAEVYDLGFQVAVKLRPEMVELGARDLLKPMDEKQSKSYTLSVTYVYLNIIIPPFSSSRAERRLESYEQSALLAIQVSQYFATHGRLPNRLEEITADHLADTFAEDRDLIYRQDGKSFSIYSIGTNGEDDGGIDDPKDGDLVISVGRRE